MIIIVQQPLFQFRNFFQVVYVSGHPVQTADTETDTE